MPLLSILAQWSTWSIAGGSSHTNSLYANWHFSKFALSGQTKWQWLEVWSIFPLCLVVRSQDTSDFSCFWHSWLQILILSRSRRKLRTTVLRCQWSGGQAWHYSHSISRRSLRWEYLALLITLNWMMLHYMSNRMFGGKLFGGSWNTDVSEMSVKGVCEMFSFGGPITLFNWWSLCGQKPVLNVLLHLIDVY